MFYNILVSVCWVYNCLRCKGPRQTQFQWVCAVCEEFGASSRVKLAASGTSSVWKSSNFERHQKSAEHKSCVAAFLGLSTPRDITLPSVDVFKEAFKAIQGGAATSAGLCLRSGNLGPAKANRCQWCLSEADCDMRRADVKGSEVMQLMRDERAGRLHCRFQSVSAAPTGDLSRGYLGQARDFNPSALGLVEATKCIFTDFCTRFLDPPPGAAVKPVFDPATFEHMRVITEATAVDSAENEVVSVRDMSESTPLMPAFTPHNRFLLRDAAHSGRRVLSRLFAACKVRNGTHKFYS